MIENGWYQSYRIKGKLTELSPKLEVDTYFTSVYKKTQIQDKVIRQFELQTNLIPSFIERILIDDNILANEFLVSDYNIFNSEVFFRKSLYPSEINRKYFTNSINSIITIKLEEKVQDRIKRNY